MGFAHFALAPLGQIQIAQFSGHVGIDTGDLASGGVNLRLVVLKLLSAEDAITQQYAALTVGNLASNVQCRDKLIRAHCVERLFALASSNR